MKTNIKECAINSSIMGASNGMTGGALQTTDSYASGDMRIPTVLGVQKRNGKMKKIGKQKKS